MKPSRDDMTISPHAFADFPQLRARYHAVTARASETIPERNLYKRANTERVGLKTAFAELANRNEEFLIRIS